MRNEDFNEVADQLGRDVATSRNERMLYQCLIDEIRGLWDALVDMGWTPPAPPQSEEEAAKPPLKNVTKKKGVTKA